MTTIYAKKALLHDGWAENVRLEVEDGRIAGVRKDDKSKPDDISAGIVIPGLANAHSHAFQRALAGHTERRSPAGKDSFWTWRTSMYRLAGLVSAERLTSIARQAYSEMLAAGYTSVAEFHYLHRQPGLAQADDAMLTAIALAAEESGIRLTYVPVLYERAGFQEAGPTDAQRQFAMSADDFIKHYERAASIADNRFGVAIGVHSLRAAAAESVARVASIARRDEVPMHLHIAEQLAEVEQCLSVHDARPVEWLLDRFSPDENWCLVHATHMNESEIDGLSQSGAVVCLCPSTEGNLGDGIFPLQKWLEHGGAIAIGSDSHITINPFEELRWLEYGQRLITRSRNVAAIRRPETGRSLFEQALEGGARACASGSGNLARGQPADLVVLDDDNPMFVGHDKESILDALVFSGFTLPIDRVMVDGKWRVIDGLHVDADATRHAYAKAVHDIQSDIEAVL